MIIRKITIENFLCYYGIKEFELADGLNIILGENGEGKTKFFEALEWLFNGDSRNLELLVSAKAINETEVNEQFRVRVSISVEQYNERKTVTKSFIAKKLEGNSCSTLNFTIDGIEENNLGERSQVDGGGLLERIFPSKIRKYSLFKGEAQLDIFKNEDALMILINSFSTAKHYDKYAEKGIYLKEKAEKAVNDATTTNTNNLKEYKRIDSEITGLMNDKSKLTVFINNTEEQIKKTEENIQEAEKYVTNAEALDTINKRIKNIEQLKYNVLHKIDENYTTALFDKGLILVNFENIHFEFSRKVSDFASGKRELQSEFDKQYGIREGKKLMKAQLLNNSIPLPVGIPSKAHMEEMLRDEWCKVCNRPAEKGSDAYIFMLNRLEEYLNSQLPDDHDVNEDRVLFTNDFINQLFNLSIKHEDNLSRLRGIKKDIEDFLEYNKKRKEELEDLEQRLKQEMIEREKVIGISSIGAEKLGNVMKNYNTWQRDLTDLNKELNDYNYSRKTIEEKIKQKKLEKDSIDTRTVNSFLVKTREIIRDLEVIFNSTKEKKINEFIQILEKKSNIIFDKINFEAFTGSIAFKRKIIAGKDVVKIELHEFNGRIFHMPNQSLLTSMHISILLAISELASELSEESYPMIFDAPTSSFGETKTTQFLNLIYENTNQKILLIKDFLAIDENTNKLVIKPEFNNVKRHKAFWVCLKRPFDRKILSTLNTQIITL